jgi:hypothetical protein
VVVRISPLPRGFYCASMSFDMGFSTEFMAQKDGGSLGRSVTQA